MSAWTCAVCGGHEASPRWRVTSGAAENGVDPATFRPSADRYGETVGSVVGCRRCGHGSLAQQPAAAVLAAAYDQAADPATLDEEPGQVATAARGLAWVETFVRPGTLADLGCWTGSLLVAAAARGWQPVGVEPSRWAVERARSRHVDVRPGDIDHHDLAPGSFRCVAMCDVLEHLLDPAAAVRRAADLLEPGGALYVTVPDAGSAVARSLGHRWWSVLPMHVQYFTRASMRRLLDDAGLAVTGIRTHPKVFTASYYAQRLGGYSAAAARVADMVVHRTGQADRAVAPDFRDRMQVVAVLR